MGTTDISILAIESSCDETSASIIVNGKVLNNIVATQSVHEKYGGVVPELASRAHQENLIPVVHEALSGAGISKNELSAIAVTRGPGLMGSLLVGVSFAKAFAKTLNLPLIDVNHMQAHVLAHFIEEPRPNFPFICLTVSGGHTQLVLVRDHLDMEVIGETQDDAVGEAFDKTAKLLGLPYPGGPLLDRYAKQGNPKAFSFPITRMPGLNYSFSGIKTAVLYFLRDQLEENPNFITENLPDLCASIQHTLVEMLLIKLKEAMKQLGLRSALAALAQRKGWKLYVPEFEYCTDNAAMIAMAAHYKYLRKDFAGYDLVPLAKLKL